MDDRGSRRKQRSSRRPQVWLQPGLGAEVLAELGPLLADEGIDLDNLDRCDPKIVQEALNRVAERANLARFTPVGQGRSLAASALREAVDALGAGEQAAFCGVLERLRPESPDGREPTVAACIGVSLGLLDQWLVVGRTTAPHDFGERLELPAVDSDSARAAADIISLARQGRAFSSLGVLVTGYCGEILLSGCVTALCAVVQACSVRSHQSVARVLLDHVR